MYSTIWKVFAFIIFFALLAATVIKMVNKECFNSSVKLLLWCPATSRLWPVVWTNVGTKPSRVTVVCPRQIYVISVFV